jgi:hypothetical protein
MAYDEKGVWEPENVIERWEISGIRGGLRYYVPDIRTKEWWAEVHRISNKPPEIPDEIEIGQSGLPLKWYASIAGSVYNLIRRKNKQIVIDFVKDYNAWQRGEIDIRPSSMNKKYRNDGRPGTE